jgi:hypothetical protein
MTAAASNPANDQLLAQLLELHSELEKAHLPLILGGGMSLYLRIQYLRTPSSPHYPFSIETRSTNDLDLFLTSDLIVNPTKIEQLRKILLRLGYVVDPKAKNFQFMKDMEIFGSRRQVRVDLLAAPPSDADSGKVEVKKPRIKPIGTTGIHAFLTEEARGIEIGRLEVPIPGDKVGSGTITIPSAYNYIILKLHAFDDRKAESDPKSDQGRHHAYDIFATVTQMGEQDWSNAAAHLKAHAAHPYLLRAVQIRKTCFSKTTDLGLLRLQENEGYRRNKAVFDSHLQQFIGDLADLFPAP